MKRNYAKHMALMLCLATIIPSFSVGNDKSDKNEFNYLYGIAAVIIGFVVGDAMMYTITPSLPSTGKMEASKYEDVSPETQDWAIKVLQKSNIKDADKIPLKKGKEGQNWEAFDRHFIVVPKDFDPAKCSRQKCLVDEFFLKHEVKHVQNDDSLKCRAVEVLVTPLRFNGKYCNIDYQRYQESEADRFAYEKATSKEELEASKKFFENLGKLSNVMEERKSHHPSCRSRAAMAQYYINKWDTEHSKA